MFAFKLYHYNCVRINRINKINKFQIRSSVFENDKTFPQNSELLKENNV